MVSGNWFWIVAGRITVVYNKPFKFQNTTQLLQVFTADNRLRIPKINHSSNGKYKCKVSNNAGVIEADFAIDVLYKPTILKIDKLNDKGQLENPSVTKLDIFTGKIYTLNCHANGNPKAETRWINGNGAVLSRTPVLVVNGSDIRHAGNRICQVENPFGKDEKKIDIDITIKPELLEKYKREHRAILGDSFELACPLNLIPNNKMHITWFQVTLNSSAKFGKIIIFNNRFYRMGREFHENGLEPIV